MGCHCAKDRSEEKDTEEHRASLALCEMRMAQEKTPQVSSNPSPMQRRKTVLFTASPVVDPIRRLTRHLSSLYLLDSVLQSWDAHHLTEAEFLPTKQKCLIKTVQKQSGRNVMQQRAKLAAEAERLAKLDHPNILRVYELMQDEKNFYLACEQFAGGQLGECLAQQQVRTEAFAASVLYQILGALAYCHHLGIAHGNICPENIVLLSSATSPKCKVRLAGFGEFDAVCPSTTNKANYSPPEALTSPTDKGDIWNCGILLYQLLTSELPFPHAKSADGCVRRRSSTYPVMTLEGNGKAANALIAAMLDRNPENRPTAVQCRNDPWMKQFYSQNTGKSTVFNQSISSLKKLHNRNPLQEGVLKFIIMRVISSTELDAAISAFFQLDKDEDGILTEDELRQNFARVMPEADARLATKRVIDAAEHNGFSSISFCEFAISFLGEKKLLSPGNLRSVFSAFDKEGAGRVSLHELKSVFSVRNSSERERQWRELILQASSMGSDSIDYGEFTALTSNFNPNS